MAPNRPAPRKWTDIQMAIAAIAMTSVLAFWNMFAGPDKEKAAEKAAAQQQAALIPAAVFTSAPTPMPTVPPVGFTILFGGVAPQPQVIVQSGGGGGGNGGGGGGSAALTSTSSS